jgi:hypothetical protein
MSILSTEQVFDFEDKRIEADSIVEQLVDWFQSRPSVYQAICVQNDPKYYYWGDIYLYMHDDELSGYAEIKVETRTTKQTPNLAIERWSKTEQQVNGGPWSTQAKYNAHLYADWNLFIMFRLPLLDWLNSEYVTFKTFQARNAGYVTSGILVPRDRLMQALGKRIGVYVVKDGE